MARLTVSLLLTECGGRASLTEGREISMLSSESTVALDLIRETCLG